MTSQMWMILITVVYVCAMMLTNHHSFEDYPSYYRVDQ